MGEDVGRYGGCFAVTQGTARGVRPRADPRHAALRVGLRRRRDRCGDRRDAPDRRDHDRQLQPARARPDHEQRGDVAAHVGRTAPRAARDPHDDRARAASSPRSTRTASRAGTPTSPGSRSSRRPRSRTRAACSRAALADPDPVLIFEHGALYNVERRRSPPTPPAVDIARAVVRRPGTRRDAHHLRRHAAQDPRSGRRRSPSGGIEAEVARPARRCARSTTHAILATRPTHAPRGDRRRGLAQRQHLGRDQRAHHGAGLLRPRRAGRAGVQRRGADALRRAPRGGGAPAGRRDRRRGPRRCWRPVGEFRMPSLGADMEAGTIVEWLVQRRRRRAPRRHRRGRRHRQGRHRGRDLRDRRGRRDPRGARGERARRHTAGPSPRTGRDRLARGRAAATPAGTTTGTDRGDRAPAGDRGRAHKPRRDDTVTRGPPAGQASRRRPRRGHRDGPGRHDHARGRGSRGPGPGGRTRLLAHLPGRRPAPEAGPDRAAADARRPRRPHGPLEARDPALLPRHRRRLLPRPCVARHDEREPPGDRPAAARRARAQGRGPRRARPSRRERLLGRRARSYPPRR